ncbi:hypothetical protein N0V83_007240 [Neocucurbitaria cava]|uniref:Uncharacterized protein n=1 Tax=Neocucurbitaria cava TaxID=798079 RepID=A0A9W8Y6J9_9PLEO|nr:hypothetical protein N0V83_007240 [Neocucurbitaria cava]
MAATNFLTVVGSFNVFLGPFMGIMFADYFLIRKRTMKLTALFDETPGTLYWYSKGWNWRAAFAWISSVWFLMPGLVQRGLPSSEIALGWTRLYQLSWFLGCLVGGIVYMLLDFFWPMPGKTVVDDADYFGTFGEVPVLQGFDNGDVSPVEVKEASWNVSEKDIEAQG